MKIVVSACLLGRNCKYNGGNNLDAHVVSFAAGREVIPVCPEECLGMPRIPMEIVDGVLINRDGTVVDEAVRGQVAQILARLKAENVECCVLKSRSPTCGARQVYDGTFSGKLVDGMGVLAQALKDGGYPVIDAEDLSDFAFHAGELQVKPLSRADEDYVVKLLTDPLVTRYFMVPDFPDEAAVRERFQRLLTLSRGRQRYVAGIYLEGECIGILNEVDRQGGEIELGIAIRSEFHRKGYGTAVLKAGAEYFLEQGFETVLAGAFVENKASIGAIEKSGMTLLERRETLTYRGRAHECIYFGRGK